MQLELSEQQVIDLYFAALRSPDVTVKRTAEPLLPVIRSFLSGVVNIPLTSGRYAQIDAEDFDLICGKSWFLLSNNNGNENAYAGTREVIDGRQVTLRMHRIILGLGEKDDAFVDHVDHDGLNNRRGNLRAASRFENRRNSRKKIGATSRYIGVTLDRSRVRDGKTGIWRAVICRTKDGKKATTHLGHYETERAAALAYNEAAIRLGGEFAKVNEIEREAA